VWSGSGRRVAVAGRFMQGNLVMSSGNQSSKRASRIFSAAISGMESLEGRRLIAADISVGGGVRRVDGAEAADRITVTPVVEYLWQTGAPSLGGSTVLTMPIYKYQVKVTNSSGTVLNGPDGKPLDRTFLRSGISRVDVVANGGSDSVHSTVAIPVRVYGGDGNDSVTSGVGDDTFYGQAGDDYADLGGGNDYFSGSTGNDLGYGWDGNDSLYGGDDNDSLYGERGNDFVDGGYGNDSVHGGYGNDTVEGGDGRDTVKGSYDNDVLKGENGDDEVYGEAGLDTLYAGAGADLLSGGDNNDVLVSVGGGQSDTVRGDDGTDTFWVDSESSEQVTSGSAETVHRIGGFQDLRVASGGQTTVQSVSRELNGQNLIDPKIDSDATYQDFSDHKLFASGGPTMADPNQDGSDAHDCYLISTLMGMTKQNRHLVDKNMVDLGDGTYAVKYHGFWGAEYIRVDGDLPTSGGELHAAAFGQEESIWVAILEKTWAFRRRNEGTYDSIDYGSPSDFLNAAGWGGSIETKANWQFWGGQEDLFNWIAGQIASGKAVIASSTANARPIEEGTDENLPINPTPVSGMRNNHVFLMDRVETGSDGVRRIVLLDPRGRTLRLTAAEVWNCCDGFTSVNFG
jgi:hypothetical protein